jgi:hypothetical protein
MQQILKMTYLVDSQGIVTRPFDFGINPRPGRLPNEFYRIGDGCPGDANIDCHMDDLRQRSPSCRAPVSFVGRLDVILIYAHIFQDHCPACSSPLTKG